MLKTEDIADQELLKFQTQTITKQLLVLDVLKAIAVEKLDQSF